MNKEEFLKELETRLKVLDSKERQDMLAEYAQHIDMKVQSGMEEQEAIKDFGDIDSLAEELLEAYHIDPDYKVLEEGETGLDKKKKSVSRYLKQKKVQREERNAARKQKENKKFFLRKKENKSSGSGVKREPRSGKKWGKEVWKSMKCTGKVCISLCLILMGIPFMIVDACTLFGLGVLLILLMQGYPLVGITIGVFGLVLCCSTCILLIFSYIFVRDVRTEES